MAKSFIRECDVSKYASTYKTPEIEIATRAGPGIASASCKQLVLRGTGKKWAMPDQSLLSNNHIKSLVLPWGGKARRRTHHTALLRLWPEGRVLSSAASLDHTGKAGRPSPQRRGMEPGQKRTASVSCIHPYPQHALLEEMGFTKPS